MTVRQPSAVYPPPTRLKNVWQLLQLAATISLPLPSGNSWLQAGSAEHSRAAAIKDRSDCLDIVPPLVHGKDQRHVGRAPAPTPVGPGHRPCASRSMLR